LISRLWCMNCLKSRADPLDSLYARRLNQQVLRPGVETMGSGIAYGDLDDIVSL
jgi:hypothetical protein